MVKNNQLVPGGSSLQDFFLLFNKFQRIQIKSTDPGNPYMTESREKIGTEK